MVLSELVATNEQDAFITYNIAEHENGIIENDNCIMLTRKGFNLIAFLAINHFRTHNNYSINDLVKMYLTFIIEDQLLKKIKSS